MQFLIQGNTLRDIKGISSVCILWSMS
uniref:Uncharacterized protein n=1 Tax=Anguilla anguilla TaxID=7936 RepID=A0A0E9PWB5_ANGAN